jgi:hypothetical protein
MLKRKGMMLAWNVAGAQNVSGPKALSVPVIAGTPTSTVCFHDVPGSTHCCNKCPVFEGYATLNVPRHRKPPAALQPGMLCAHSDLEVAGQMNFFMCW